LFVVCFITRGAIQTQAAQQSKRALELTTIEYAAEMKQKKEKVSAAIRKGLKE
jgi:hypothetical protein